VDIIAFAQLFFHAPFDASTVEYAWSLGQPASLIEMLVAFASIGVAKDYKGAAMLATGEYDVLSCGGNCARVIEYGVQNATFPSAKAIETYLHPGAGHGVNFARNATTFFGKLTGFVDRNV
jgi:hypothetical protein